MIEKKDFPVLLVDSQCAVCNRSVRFIRKHQGKGRILFRSLQSDEGKKYLKRYGFPEDYDRSLVYIHHHKAYVRSDAVLRITRKMSGLFPLLSAFLLIPRKIRDPLYDLVARHRHHIPV